MLIDFDDAGSGPAVALLHSSLADRRMWDPQWSVLSGTGLRVVRVDFRGHGSTPAPTSPFNAACDVVAVLDECGIDRVTLIGSSYGGRVAQEVAARWPRRAVALQLWCAATRLHPPTLEDPATANELLLAHLTGTIGG